MASRILLVDDDVAFCKSVCSSLEDNGYVVTVANNAAQARHYFENRSFSLILLDLMLPDADGLDLCGELRARSMVPVLVTSARQDQGDRMAALELGADGYLAKPFEVRELHARIAACLRRAGEPWSDDAGLKTLLAAGVRLDTQSRRAWVDDAPVSLTPKEFDLLRALMSKAGYIWRSEELLWRIWGYDNSIQTRTLCVHVGRLRAKIEEKRGQPERIVTVPGVGYMFVDLDAAA